MQVARPDRLRRSWYACIVGVSVALVLVTFAAYGLDNQLLYLIGLGGENNIGAWWSGMLMLLAAVFAYDGYAARDKAARERRGWLALAVLLLVLSFDEVASLHEYLSAKGTAHLAPLAGIVLALSLYALASLYASPASRRVLVQILVAFGFLGTIPIQEHVQHAREWNDPVVYGLRAVAEEGAEIVAMLLLVAAARPNSARMFADRRRTALAALRLATPLMLSAAVLIPILVAATFILPYPGGPADWLACSLFFGCALIAARDIAQARQPTSASAALLIMYLAASAASNAISLQWDPEVFGVAVGLRGAFFTVLLLAAPAMLRANGRQVNTLSFAAAAAAVASASVLQSESQWLWCLVPPALALWLFQVESRSTWVGAVLPVSGADVPARVPAE